MSYRCTFCKNTYKSEVQRTKHERNDCTFVNSIFEEAASSGKRKLEQSAIQEQEQTQQPTLNRDSRTGKRRKGDRSSEKGSTIRGTHDADERDDSTSVISHQPQAGPSVRPEKRAYSPAAQHRERGHVELSQSTRGRHRFANTHFRPVVRKLQTDYPTLFTITPRDLEPIHTISTDQPSFIEGSTTQKAHLAENLAIPDWKGSPKDSYGLYRVYPTQPTFIPGFDSLDDVCDGPEFTREKPLVVSTGRAGVAEDENTDDADGEGSDPTSNRELGNASVTRKYDPFPNSTIHRTVSWFSELKGNVLTPDDVDTFVDTVIHAENDPFDPSHFPKPFRLAKELKRVDEYQIPTHAGPNPTFSPVAGWREATIDLALPCARKGLTTPHTFPVRGLQYRSIVEIIKAEFPSATDRNDFHLMPYKLLWDINDSEPNLPQERVITEMYNSDAMIEEHIKIQRAQFAKGDDREIVVAGIMLWSDSTHLADFGSASMWPSYMGFANQTKYTRTDPRTHSLHHLAYMPEVPDELVDHYTKVHGRPPTAAVLTQLKRDLFQGVYNVLLDDDFVDAYENGIEIEFSDGWTRVVFPRIISYSADYPEKIMIVSIKCLGSHPCPLCNISMDDVDQLGTAKDDIRRKDVRTDSIARQRNVTTARKGIFRKGWAVTSDNVKDRVGKYSGVAVENAFSTKLLPLSVDFFRIIMPDILHAIEQGAWRAVALHLMRLVHALNGSNGLPTVNERYRKIKTFSRRIRKFRNNIDEMTGLAARDYEDMLQCAIPVFDGLFPEPLNGFILDLLFVLAVFHGLSKLRLHTTSTRDFMRAITADVGEQLRTFRDNCKTIPTKELKSEKEKRLRRQAKGGKGSAQVRSEDVSQQAGAATTSEKGIMESKVEGYKAKEREKVDEVTEKAKGKSKSRKPVKKTGAEMLSGQHGKKGTHERNAGDSEKDKNLKTFNMHTYKFHELGHYVDSIFPYGTLDNQSTQWGEVEHQSVKAWYARTNKKRYVVQVARHQHRQDVLRYIQKRIVVGNQVSPTRVHPKQARRSLRGSAEHDEEALPKTLPDLPYTIAKSTRTHVDIDEYCLDNEQDPAVMNFEQDLTEHALSRILPLDQHPENGFTLLQRNGLDIQQGRIYTHKTFRINYTTYNLRRTYDTLKVRDADVMVLLDEGDGVKDEDRNPYAYAHLLAVGHMMVRYNGPGGDRTGIFADGQYHRMEVLRVRWYEQDDNYTSGWKSRRLPRLSLIHSSDRGAYGFLDPLDVIRGCHIMPAFRHDTREGGSHRAVSEEDHTEPHEHYYVGIFVDRDMLMRYVGGAPGHITTKETSRFLSRLSYAYSQEFAHRRAQELADLGHEEGISKENAEGIESSSEDDNSGPDAGAEERSDTSDYFPELDDDYDDCAYRWNYPEEDAGVPLARKDREDTARSEEERREAEEENEDGRWEDGEMQMLGYDAD